MSERSSSFVYKSQIVNTFPVEESEGYEDPKPIINEFTLANRNGLRDILAWYGAFYSGDPYMVTVNGREIDLDKNGEITHVTIENEGVTLLLPRI